MIRSKNDQLPRTIQLRTETSNKIIRPIQKLAIPEWEILEEDDPVPTSQFVRIEDIHRVKWTRRHSTIFGTEIKILKARAPQFQIYLTFEWISPQNPPFAIEYYTILYYTTQTQRREDARIQQDHSTVTATGRSRNFRVDKILGNQEMGWLIVFRLSGCKHLKGKLWKLPEKKRSFPECSHHHLAPIFQKTSPQLKKCSATSNYYYTKLNSE